MAFNCLRFHRHHSDDLISIFFFLMETKKYFLIFMFHNFSFFFSKCNFDFFRSHSFKYLKKKLFSNSKFSEKVRVDFFFKILLNICTFMSCKVFKFLLCYLKNYIIFSSIKDELKSMNYFASFFLQIFLLYM